MCAFHLSPLACQGGPVQKPSLRHLALKGAHCVRSSPHTNGCGLSADNVRLRFRCGPSQIVLSSCACGRHRNIGSQCASLLVFHFVVFLVCTNKNCDLRQTWRCGAGPSSQTTAAAAAWRKAQHRVLSLSLHVDQLITYSVVGIHGHNSLHTGQV